MSACAALLLVTGCGSTAPGAGDASAIVGSWHYVGAQTSGQRISYDGVVTITQATGSNFAGGFNLQSSTPQGAIVQLNGVIGGRASNDAIDFDMEFTDDTQRHVGKVKGDSITGTWANADATSIGSFTMTRNP